MTKPNDPILKSEKLSSLTQNLAKQKANAAQSRAEVWRLTKMVSPHNNYDVTSSTVWDSDIAEFARIGLINGRQEICVVPTGDQDESARRKVALDRTLAGETLATPIGIKEQIETAQRQWSATEDAIEFLTREIEQEKTALAIQYSKTMKPKHDALMDTVCKKILETHAAWRDLYALKRHLIDSEVGLRGLCLTMPDFLSAPNNPHSEMADFLRSAKNDGFISAVPKEMRL
jgi:hypothetical protein